MDPGLPDALADALNTQPKPTPQLIDVESLMKAVGILGMTLPVLLIAGQWLTRGTPLVLESISDYYHSRMQDLFVGVLCGIALFLFAYKGYDMRDRIASLLACVFSLGVAFFPTTPHAVEADLDTTGILHFLFAAALFIVLTVFALYLFRLSDDRPGDRSHMKRVRNRVYTVCGLLMVFSLVAIVAYMMFLAGSWTWLDRWQPVFLFESLALVSFGFSWLVKGGFLLRDKGV